MTDLELLKKLVIAWDADQDDELDEAIDEARAHCGFTLAADADDVLVQVRTANQADQADDEEADGE